MKTILFVVDPQNDFCDPNGALVVLGANKDMDRLSSFLINSINELDHVEITMDSHRWGHIAHPFFWVNKNNENPKPFTIIQLEDFERGEWRPRNQLNYDVALAYLKELNIVPGKELCVWPPHCIIGTWGHNIYLPLAEALKTFELVQKIVNYTLKGMSLFTEHYSALRAEVEIPDDRSTILNNELLTRISNADRLIVAGEASSHCVACTIRDTISELGQDFAKKIILLTDTMSPVPGFEQDSEGFLKEMENLGASLKTTETCFA